jgi:CheY-like chemotaxis protein
MSLRSQGFQCDESSDGEEGLERFLQQPHRYSLVVLDLIMPNRNGRDVLEAIRAVRPELPIVVMSGYSPDDWPLRLDAQTGFLAKPFRTADLLTLIRRQFKIPGLVVRK